MTAVLNCSILSHGSLITCGQYIVVCPLHLYLNIFTREIFRALDRMCDDHRKLVDETKTDSSCNGNNVILVLTSSVVN